MKFSSYDPGEFYDELFEGIGRPRRGSALLLRKFASLPDGELRKRQQAAERVILNMGMTFGVYGSNEGMENTPDSVNGTLQRTIHRIADGELRPGLELLRRIYDDTRAPN